MLELQCGKGEAAVAIESGIRCDIIMHTRFSNDEIASRGQSLYEREIRANVEGQHDGRFLVLDIETGEYEIADLAVDAVRRMKARHADPALFIIRIGRPAAYRLGAHLRVRPT